MHVRHTRSTETSPIVRAENNRLVIVVHDTMAHSPHELLSLRMSKAEALKLVLSIQEIAESID